MKKLLKIYILCIICANYYAIICTGGTVLSVLYRLSACFYIVGNENLYRVLMGVVSVFSVHLCNVLWLKIYVL